MRHKHASKAQIPEWVVTYGDMMSLLLCFFILLAALSELKKEEDWRIMVAYIKDAFGFDNGLGSVPEDDGPILPEGRADDLDTGRGEHSTDVQNDQLNVRGRNETVSMINERIKSTIGGSLVFPSGSAELSERAERALREAAGLISGHRNKVEIRGHAWGVDDQAPGLDQVDLSYRRAKAVTNFLIQECNVDRLLLSPVAAGSTEPLRISRWEIDESENRRVQVIMSEVLVEEIHPDPNGTGAHGWDADQQGG